MLRSYNKIRSIVAALDGLRGPALHLAQDVGVLDVVGEGVYHWVVALFDADVEIVLGLGVIGAGTDAASGTAGLVQVLTVPLHLGYFPFPFEFGQFLWIVGHLFIVLVLPHFGCGVCC